MYADRTVKKRDDKMGLFIKKIKCPKCKSINYIKIDMEDGNAGVSGVLLNAFDVGGRSRMASSTPVVRGNFTEYFKCNDCGTVFPYTREK